MSKLSPSVAKIVTVTGLLLGAFAISVFATDVVSQPWTAAPCPPTGTGACNAAAPLNVSNSAQAKVGSLMLGSNTPIPKGPDTVDQVFGVEGSGTVSRLWSVNELVTNSLWVGGVDRDKVGYVLTNDSSGNGTVAWKPPYIPQTQAVSCTNVGNTSYISLNGNNSGNNGAILVNVGTLPAGQYTISGTGISTYNVGGGGAAGVFVDGTANLTTADMSSKLPYLNGAKTYGTGDSYKMYYQSDYANTVFMLKRNGTNDATNFNVPIETFTFTQTTYVYIFLAQSAVSGSLTVNGSKSICGSGGSSGGSNYHYITPTKSTVVDGGNTFGVIADGDVGFNNEGVTHWGVISYPTTIPSTAKSVIVRAYAATDGCRIQMYVKDDGFPQQTVVSSSAVGGGGVGGADSSIFNIPYSTDKQFEATTATSGSNPCGTVVRNLYIIGYTD